MKHGYLFNAALALAVTAALGADLAPRKLPPPHSTGGMPLMQALKNRRTVRDYRTDPLPPQVMSDLLWAAFGVNRPESGMRTAPSAWNAQEIDVYVLTPTGVFLYDAGKHSLVPVVAGDWRVLTGGGDFTAVAPVTLLYVADYSKMSKAEPAERAETAAADAAFIGQNVYLFCASEGLGTVIHEGIDETAVANKLGLRPDQHSILGQAVGYPAK